MPISAGQNGLASDFINESTGAGDEGKVPKLNASGVLDSSFHSWEFGDGSDGDVTISTPTTLTRDMYYNNLIVTDILTTDGYRIYVKGTISGAGTIKWGTPNNGGNAGNVISNALPGGAGASATGSGTLKNFAGGAGGASGGNGEPGSAGVNGVSSNPGIGVVGTVGGRGGADTDGNYGGNSGGSGGAITPPNIKFGVSKLSVVEMVAIFNSTLSKITGSGGTGGGGAGGSANSEPGGPGGGSGATGGIIWIACNKFAGSFDISNIGGNGGNGGGAEVAGSSGGVGGGGSGGSGGVNIIIYKIKTWTGSNILTGGTAGTMGSPGSTTNATNGLTGTTGVAYEIPIKSLL